VIVGDVRLQDREGRQVLSARVHPERGHRVPFDLSFQVEGGEPGWMTARGDPFVPALLLLALASGEDLRVEAPVSSLLLRSTATVAEIYRQWKDHRLEWRQAWHGEGRRGLVIAEPAQVPERPNATSAFFSCGVDAFYTFLKHRERITHLVFVDGFEARLRREAIRRQVLREVRDVARETGMRLVTISTNVPEAGREMAPWALYHGAALISSALALGGLLGTVLVPSSNQYEVLAPWGSHPLLDPLWSTEATRVVHDGCEAWRLDKVRMLARSDLALRHLRVCGAGEGDRLNCGRCDKCIPTAMVLKAEGVLDRARTFDTRLDPAAVRRVRTYQTMLESSLPALGGSREDRRLRRAVRRALLGHDLDRAAWVVRSRLPGFAARRSAEREATR
jgi:hypothetical protein